jgi:hypothetical protein
MNLAVIQFIRKDAEKIADFHAAMLAVCCGAICEMPPVQQVSRYAEG